MAARSGVVDTSVFKGVADLRAEVLSNDPVVAPAHEVVQDSDLVADPSALTHADATPDHGVDTAVTSTEEASAGDAGHVHADLAYADSDHGYSDVDHAYADHAYADHAYADATVPDSAVAFADHSLLPADDGTPHSLGADAAKGQGDDGHDAAAWWWVGGAALAGAGIGFWIGYEDDDNNNVTSSAANSDVHVVVERDGAWIDTNGDGDHDVVSETDAAVFGSGGNASLVADHVTIHFNDVPLEALNITGFGADDKIEFHVQSLMDNSVLSPGASHLTDVYLGTNPTFPSAARVEYSFSSSTEITVRHATLTATDFSGNVYSSVYALSVSSIDTDINGFTAAIAYWTDAGNALNDNALLLPNLVTGTNTNTVVANLNANNEGGLIDFIWPSGAPIG